ncbi:hypothetical protein KKI90_11315 [Xenorhabdus bovienii]|uniref:Terminase n=1 Tax=Xenorhabdus bovienii TaxID=40576 RepID=A0AAJ1JAR2_XENBV|nr:hypothetical protein [Xenorhabdus bovienii]MDE1480257.1 hypothetical protein [Xenorhabdus bovienii]MDE1486955.1 hypothetical protein [Xenorhabdus bovienii]MDE1495657.1 hypothetical protein [Xenorhabdus bovienii]MDE9477797.1 hypothetical protein [Xenorhabdus bovienii]MDE9511927.1 hypothetical protein [Xenorhabdus bovienii]
MNWQEHVSNFNRLRAENGISIREYAEHYNLNPNTARRYLRSTNPAKSDDQKDDHASKDDQRLTKRKSLKDEKNTLQSRTSTGITQGKQKGITDTSERNRQTKSADSQNAKMIISPAEIIAHKKLPRGEGRRLAVGNETSMKHGRYATPRSMDLEKAGALMGAGYLDVLEVDLMWRALAHFELVERIRDRSIEELEKQEAKFNPEEDALHPAFKQLKMLNDCSYAMTDFMRTMTSMKQGLLKSVREEEKHAAKMGETTVIAEAYKCQLENEWDAMQTAVYIESNGGKVPPALLEKLRHDMKQDQGDNVDNNIIDQDELDRQAREYQEKQAERDAYIAVKRQLVDEIVDKGGYGDIDNQGDGREGESLDSLEEEPDYDYEATNDIYDEED